MAAFLEKYFGEGLGKLERRGFFPGVFRIFGSKSFWIVIAVLMYSAAIGYIASSMRPTFALILGSLPVVVMIAWNMQYHLYLAPILLVIVSAFTHFRLSTGTESVIVDGLMLTSVIVAIWALQSIIVNRKLEIYPYPINKPLIGYMATVPVSLIWSILFRDPFVYTWDTFIFVQLATGFVMIMLPAAFLIVGNFVRDMKTLHIMVGLFIAAGFLGLLWDYRIIPLPINTGGLFTMWIVGLSVGLAIFNHNLSKVWRGLLLILAAAWLYYRFGQNISWIAGWLPPFSLLFALFFMRSRKLFLVLVFMLLLIVAFNFDYYIDAYGQEKAESGFTRMAAWNLNWSITSRHILFGTGPGGYAAYLMTYYPTRAMATHSNYIDLLAQLGIVGIGFYLWFFFRLVLMGYNLCKRLRGRLDFAEAMANVAFAGTLGCVVAMVFGDWLIPFPYTQTIGAFDYINYSWIIMGFILVLDRFTRNTPGTPGMLNVTLPVKNPTA